MAKDTLRVIYISRCFLGSRGGVLLNTGMGEAMALRLLRGRGGRG